MIRALTDAELADPAFADLVLLAAEVDADALARIVQHELPRLCVVGVVEGEHVVAFAAADLRTEPALLEYIAVGVEAQGRALGRSMVDHLRARTGGGALVAETDDDAIGFYRALGFSVTTAPSDPRWPGRARYRCTLD